MDPDGGKFFFTNLKLDFKQVLSGMLFNNETEIVTIRKSIINIVSSVCLL